MRNALVYGFVVSLGLLAGCPGPLPLPEEIPGGDSETAGVFEETAMELYGSVELLTLRQVLEVLELAVEDVSPGSHAGLNAAAVALDKGEEDKAIGHLEQFIDKVEKERGKKVAEDDADFMTFIAQVLIEEI